MVTTKSYTFSNVTGNHTISAEFTNMTTTVRIYAGAGSSDKGSVRYKINSGSWVTVSDLYSGTDITVNVGDNLTVEATGITSGYRFKHWLVSYESTQVQTITSNPYTETGVLDDGLEICIEFEAIPTYTITATAGTGGTITPSGTVTVQEGGSQPFQIQANTGYVISRILVDGSPITL